jgi:hypothetical protein
MKHGVIIHPEEMGELLNMKAEECGEIVQNMIRTFNGEGVKVFDDRYLDFVSATLCGRVLRDKQLSEKQSRNGRQGGAKIGNQNAKTSQKQPKNKPKTTQKQAKTSPNTKTKTNTNTNTNNKRLYGECANVLLTDDEFQKIKDKGYTELIEELSLYIASKGDKYKNHYAVICQWANRRKKENKVVPFSGDNAKNQFNRFTQRTDDIDYNRLIKN